jgi:hypothetical protein
MKTEIHMLCTSHGGGPKVLRKFQYMNPMMPSITVRRNLGKTDFKLQGFVGLVQRNMSSSILVITRSTDCE